MSYIRRFATLFALIWNLDAGAAGPEQIRAMCEQFSRPAIDCSCVARRIEQYRVALPAGTSDAMLVEGYRGALGMANEYGAALEAFYRDPRQAVAVEMALESLGGMPSAIDDFEEGCVVAGAARANLPPWPREPATEDYVEGCFASSGDQRFCECAVARLRARVSRDQFEAYYRSFSDYSDRNVLSLAEMSRARARAMGISEDEYTRLVQSGRERIDATSEADMTYCGVLLWAEGQAGDPPSVVAARYRESAPTVVDSTEAPEATRTTISPANSAGGDGRFPEARALVADGCQASGEGAEHCACVAAAVEEQVFSQIERDSVALAYALISFSDGLNPVDMMQMMSQLSSDDQMAAAMLLGSTDPAGSCY